MPGFKNFNYLDQLVTTEIDFTKYLEDFSDDNYTLEFRNDQPVVSTMTNLFEQVNLVKNFKERGTSFFLYDIKENELPEDVSFKHYGTIDFWWVICLFNDIKQPLTDWPMNDDQINYLVTEFARIEDKYSPETYFDLMFEKNEERRRLQILKRNQINDLVFQFKNVVIGGTIISDKFTITI